MKYCRYFYKWRWQQHRLKNTAKDTRCLMVVERSRNAISNRLNGSFYLKDFPCAYALQIIINLDFFIFLLKPQNPDESGQNASSVPMHRNRNQGAFLTHSSLKKISPCGCLVFVTLLNPLHTAKPKRLHNPKHEIFLHSTSKIGHRFRATMEIMKSEIWY